ncbi:MAG: hypothetical protein ACJARY_003275 [Candidatus Azotimanducaceae bacterium]|jgi:hypothetical protein
MFSPILNAKITVTTTQINTRYYALTQPVMGALNNIGNKLVSRDTLKLRVALQQRKISAANAR